MCSSRNGKLAWLSAKIESCNAVDGTWCSIVKQTTAEKVLSSKGSELQSLRCKKFIGIAGTLRAPRAVR
jgi:hypothetical protein